MTRKVLQGLFLFHQITQGIWPSDWFVRKPRTDLVKDYRSRFGSKKEWGLVKPVYWVLIRDLACSFHHCWRNSLQTYSHRNSLIPLPKKIYIKIYSIYYYYKLLLFICWCMLLLWNESHCTQELTTDIHTVIRTVWFRCPEKFKSKFIQYIIIINYYYSFVDACCYYEMRVIALRNSLQT